MSFFSDLLEMKYRHYGSMRREKAIVAEDVRDQLLAIAKKSNLPASGAGVVTAIYDVAVFVHEKMPAGHMIVVDYEMSNDLAVEIYLAQQKAKEEKENVSMD